MPPLSLANHAVLRSPRGTSFATPLERPQWVGSRYPATGRKGRPPLDLGLLRDLQGIVNLDAQVSDGAFELGMS